MDFDEFKLLRKDSEVGKQLSHYLRDRYFARTAEDMLDANGGRCLSGDYSLKLTFGEMSDFNDIVSNTMMVLFRMVGVKYRIYDPELVFTFMVSIIKKDEDADAVQLLDNVDTDRLVSTITGVDCAKFKAIPDSEIDVTVAPSEDLSDVLWTRRVWNIVITLKTVHDADAMMHRYIGTTSRPIIHGPLHSSALRVLQHDPAIDFSINRLIRRTTRYEYDFNSRDLTALGVCVGTSLFSLDDEQPDIVISYLLQCRTKYVDVHITLNLKMIDASGAWCPLVCGDETDVARMLTCLSDGVLTVDTTRITLNSDANYSFTYRTTRDELRPITKPFFTFGDTPT